MRVFHLDTMHCLLLGDYEVTKDRMGLVVTAFFSIVMVQNIVKHGQGIEDEAF